MYLVKELIISYRKTFKSLELDLPSYIIECETTYYVQVVLSSSTLFLRVIDWISID